MPTENRSSNTDQMVSVPRDEVERLVKLLKYQAHPYPSPHAEFWQGLLDAPAQHQHAPLGWVYDGGQEFTSDPDKAHDLRAEGIELTDVYGHAQHQGDPDRALKDALFACLAAGGDDREYGGVATAGDRQGWVRFTTVATGAQHQGEPVALPARRDESTASYTACLQSSGWNAYHDEVAKLGPLYTHPDAGEVERLREELDLIKISFDRNFDAAQEAKAERDTLRAQLAEQDALLRRCLLAVREQHCDEGEADFDLPAPLLSDIDAALSAQVRPAEAGELERLRAALKFYADREHYHFESGNWDTVSGEPLNILWCGDDPDFIEDGSVARAALSTSAVPSNDLCAEGAHEFVPFRSKCVKCGEPYSAEPSAREAQALKDESRLGIERLPAEPSAPDELEGVEDLARRIAARVKARAALERKP